jgi:hypothetical protein
MATIARKGYFPYCLGTLGDACSAMREAGIIRIEERGHGIVWVAA